MWNNFNAKCEKNSTLMWKKFNAKCEKISTLNVKIEVYVKK